MQSKLRINQNDEIHQDSNQFYLTVCKDLQETNRQSSALNDLLLEERRKNEKQDRLKSDFFANMVHEIRSPLCAIKSFAQFLQAPGIQENEKIEYTLIINRCADNLLNLVNDILDISKIEAGQLTINERKCNLKDLFNELFELFNAPSEENKSKEVQLKYCIELNYEQYIVNADYTRLKQVLTNLISNALKFTKKGHVLFGCRLVNNKILQFYVEDTGIGIDPNMHTKIFERYKQVNDSCHLNQCKGSGLGLFMVKSLVKLMHGKVWVTSAPDFGSTFYFTIPYNGTMSTEINSDK